jgi:hypothetical protein
MVAWQNSGKPVLVWWEKRRPPNEDRMTQPGPLWGHLASPMVDVIEADRTIRRVVISCAIAVVAPFRTGRSSLQGAGRGLLMAAVREKTRFLEYPAAADRDKINLANSRDFHHRPWQNHSIRNTAMTLVPTAPVGDSRRASPTARITRPAPRFGEAGLRP